MWKSRSSHERCYSQTMSCVRIFSPLIYYFLHRSVNGSSHGWGQTATPDAVDISHGTHSALEMAITSGLVGAIKEVVGVGYHECHHAKKQGSVEKVTITVMGPPTHLSRCRQSSKLTPRSRVRNVEYKLWGLVSWNMCSPYDIAVTLTVLYSNISRNPRTNRREQLM